MRSALSSVVLSDVCWPQVQGGPLLSMLICHRAPLAFCFGAAHRQAEASDHVRIPSRCPVWGPFLEH